MAWSTKEMEYMSSTHAFKEVVWSKRLFAKYAVKQKKVRCDNQRALYFAKIHVFLAENTLMCSIMLFAT